MSGLLTPLPLEFIRQFEGLVDQDMSFDTTADRMAYLTSPRRTSGQLASDLEMDGAVFVMNTARTAWNPVGANNLVIGLGSKSFSKTFDGTTGNGEVGTLSIEVTDVPINSFITFVWIDVVDTLISDDDTAFLTLGIAGDNETAGMDAGLGLVTGLNTNGVTGNITPEYTKATTNRTIVMAVGGSNITAGILRVIVVLTDKIIQESGSGDSGISIQVNEVPNDVQDVLDFQDSDTITFEYTSLGGVTAHGVGSETLQQAFDASVTAGDNPRILATSDITFQRTNEEGNFATFIELSDTSARFSAQQDEGPTTSEIVLGIDGTINLSSSINSYVIGGLDYTFPSAQGTAEQVLGISSVDGGAKATLYWKDVSGGGGGGNTIYSADDLLEGNRSVGLDGHSLVIAQAGYSSPFFSINPTSGNEDVFLLASNVTGNNVAGMEGTTTTTTGTGILGASTASQSAVITTQADESGALSSITYSAKTHTFDNDLLVNGIIVGRSTGNISSNTAVGSSALSSNTTGSDNVAIGINCLFVNQSGTRNIAIGSNAVFTNLSGSYNIGIGYSALSNNSVGSSNTAIGVQALQSNTGNYNTAIGYRAAVNTGNSSFNVAVGYTSLSANTDGSSNTAVGSGAVANNTTASENTGVGAFALAGVTIGDNNTAVGSHALFSTLIGTNNIAVGSDALGFSISSNYNSAYGVYALRYTELDNNTAIGANSNAVFVDDTSSQKTFDFTDIDISGLVYITPHGFGADGTYRLLRFNQGTSTVNGMIDNTVYRVLIIDSGTLQFETILTGGTSTGNMLTPQFQYTNSTAIGANSQNTDSNEIMLGDNLNEAIILAGGLRDFLNDAAAALGTPAVKVGQLYRNGNIVMIRVS